MPRTSQTNNGQKEKRLSKIKAHKLKSPHPLEGLQNQPLIKQWFLTSGSQTSRGLDGGPRRAYEVFLNKPKINLLILFCYESRLSAVVKTVI